MLKHTVSNQAGCLSLKKQSHLLADGFDPSLSFISDCHLQIEKEKGLPTSRCRGEPATKASLVSASYRKYY